MSLGDKMNQMATQIQEGVKTTSASIALTIFKGISCFFVALTVSLVAQEIMQYGTLSFIFMLVVVMGLLFKLMQSWSFGRTAVFDLICILVALVLRMYVLLAP